MTASHLGTPILLANLLQRSQADVSTPNFPGSYEFEEAARWRITALWSSPTVSELLFDCPKSKDKSIDFTGHNRMRFRPPF